MSRKRPTQVELERENADLKKQVQQLQKRLKQSNRQLRDQEEVEMDKQAILDHEQEASFAEIQKKIDDDFIVVTLPNGREKKIRKRTPND